MEGKMTPCQMIMREIILIAKRADPGLPVTGPLESGEDVEREYYNLDNEVYDIQQEFRHGTEKTDIPAPGVRHYESRSVAAQMSDGQWVGWTYWHGGGKYGYPENIPWMEDAYLLDCSEKTVVVKVFKKRWE
jgi:hypothetical protein